MKSSIPSRVGSGVLGAVAVSILAIAAGSCGKKAVELSDPEVDNLVRRSYQYVAMYNVNNKFAAKLGGWNIVDPDTTLKDHTMREIARPNNDTYYTSCLLDLRAEPVILDVPPFDSEYASLMVTAYDHYVTVPLASRLGDFRKPEKILFYSERTEGYTGEPIDGVDRTFETTGDFVSAVFRVMPHVSEPARYRRIVDQMLSVKLTTLSEYRGGTAAPVREAAFPAVGKTDADVFGTNLLEVMQFVFNHTTFDPTNAEDQAVLAAYEPLGVKPGQSFDPDRVAAIDGARFREVAEKIQREWLATTTDPTVMGRVRSKMFQMKGKTDLETVLAVSIIGPIGLPQEEAVYPAVGTSDGKPMNAMNDYVIRMSRQDLPPARAFWSVTLYDMDNGFFIPNDRKKYSVGLNGGMKLDRQGGIEIHIAAERPAGVPDENWLPIQRKDENLSVILRIYAPDLTAFETWTVPRAEKVAVR